MKNSKIKIIDFIPQGRRNCTRINLRCINFWCSLLLYNYFYQYYCIYPCLLYFLVFIVLFNSSKVNFHFQCLNSLLLEKASLSSNYMCTFSAATNKNCTGETQSRNLIELVCWLIYENWGSLGVNLNEKARWLWYCFQNWFAGMNFTFWKHIIPRCARGTKKWTWTFNVPMQISIFKADIFH